MSENQSPSQELLDLERMGWQRCDDGWYLPKSTMHNPVTYQDAITMNKVLMEWAEEAKARNS